SFAGWFTSPQGGEFVSPDSRFADYSGSSILELYAHWDGAFVVLGTGVTATVGSISYTGYATVPMNGAMELSFDDGLGFYYAYGFDVSGNVLTPVNGSSFFTVAAKPADYTQVDLALGGGESACTGFRVTPGSALPASYAQPSRTGYDFVGYKNVGGTIVIPAVSGSGTPSFAPDVSGFTDHNRCWINTSSAVTLTAVWIPHTTRVIYHNMGVTPDVEETAVYGQDFPFIESPVSSDARFEGYCDAVTPDGKASGNLLIKRGCYYAEEGLSPYFDGHYTWIGDIEEFHLYALWIPKYVLKVDGVSADLSGDEVFEVQTPYRAGYSFTGWLLSGAVDFSTARYGTSADSVSLPISDGTVFSADPTYVRSLCSVPGGIVMMNSQWEPVTYRVIFNLDGGIGPANTDMVYDTVYEINSPTRSGYFFAGWTISGNATAEALYGATEDTVDQWFSGTCYTGSSMFVKNLSFDPSKRVMLTAVWGQGAYTVRFDPNAAGTEGEMQDQLFSFGLSQNLYRCDYSRTGYAFSGWAVTPGGGVVYKDCQNVTDIASENGEIVTLYAVWTIQQYTFSFRNTGATAIENITLDYGAAVPVPADPEYPKYVFIGWSYLGNLTEIPTVMPARDMEFSAVWEPDSYTVSFDSNGGRGTMGSVDIVYFQTSLLPANVFTKTGYKFASWNTQKNGGGVSYADKAPVTDLGDTVLYAQWAAVKYTVVFHSNTDPEMTSSQIMTYGVSKKLAYNTFENPGYAFDSWNTKADGSGTSYVDGQTVRNLAKTDGAVVNLYAKWTPVTAYITLAKGDHGAADGLAHVSYGDARAIVDTPVIGVGHDVLFYGESVSGAELTPVIYPDGTLEEGSSYVSGGKWIYTGTSLTLTACCVDPLYDGMEFAFEGLKYKVISAEKRTASLIGSEGNITKLTVPEKAVCLGYELSVTSIGANAFFKSPTLKSADLGSVTTIGNSAFKQCGYLASVDVGENLKSIGSYAFYKCFALKT
ncbi:MAG: InlB B-repeat-containing protein, partial [Candidatus Methanomethylophilaceae archaeon]|nr:InlB B-repeat-containing protein [Candidatus Methanomethylophilaceae archaeon]